MRFEIIDKCDFFKFSQLANLPTWQTLSYWFHGMFLICLLRAGHSLNSRLKSFYRIIFKWTTLGSQFWYITLANYYGFKSLLEIIFIVQWAESLLEILTNNWTYWNDFHVFSKWNYRTKQNNYKYETRFKYKCMRTVKFQSIMFSSDPIYSDPRLFLFEFLFIISNVKTKSWIFAQKRVMLTNNSIELNN